MKKLLYVGHTYHNKTKSTQFLQDLLASKYEVTNFNYDPYMDFEENLEILQDTFFDVVVFFQVMPSMTEFDKLVKYKHKVFFPMYDDINNMEDILWGNCSDCIIINFSKTLHEKCLEYGLASFYIQYFPKPEEVENWGDEESVFLWQRRSEINPCTVNNIVGIENISKLYWHKAPDPQVLINPVPTKWKSKIQTSEWFETKAEMKKYLQQSAIYFAPRLFEGIGMSFLDAMAIGRCVIAPNNPTMNEYITDGVNGYLYNYKKQKRINLTNIREIQKNTIEFIKNGYKDFEQNKHKILDWIEADVQSYCNKKLMDSMLNTKPVKKYKITWLKIKHTKKYVTFYILGLLPIKIPRGKD